MAQRAALFQLDLVFCKPFLGAIVTFLLCRKRRAKIMLLIEFFRLNIWMPSIRVERATRVPYCETRGRHLTPLYLLLFDMSQLISPIFMCQSYEGTTGVTSQPSFATNHLPVTIFEK